MGNIFGGCVKNRVIYSDSIRVWGFFGVSTVNRERKVVERTGHEVISSGHI